jgi:SulP family sulfate permease
MTHGSRDSLHAARALPEPRRVPLASALRATCRRRYSLDDLRADLLARTVVALVALPLSMALALAIGVPPVHGIYSTVVEHAKIDAARLS